MFVYKTFIKMVRDKFGNLVPSGLRTKVIDRELSLSGLIVTVTTGKKFYADPVSRADLADAIAIAQEKNQTETMWKLAEPINGTKWNMVTLAEVQEARELALLVKGTIIGA